MRFRASKNALLLVCFCLLAPVPAYAQDEPVPDTGEQQSVVGGQAFGEENPALTPIVAAAVRPGDLVAVKGSNGSRMSIVVEAVVGLGPITLNAANGN